MKLNQFPILAVLLILAGMVYAQPKSLKPTSDGFLKAEAKKDAAFLHAEVAFNKAILPQKERYRADLNKIAPMVEDVDDLQALKLEVKYLDAVITKLKNPDAPEPGEHTTATFKDMKVKAVQKRHGTLMAKTEKTMKSKKIAALKVFKKALDKVRRAALLSDNTDEAVAVKREQMNADELIKELTGLNALPKGVQILLSNKWKKKTKVQHENNAIYEFKKDGSIIVTHTDGSIMRGRWSAAKPDGSKILTVFHNGSFRITMSYLSSSAWKIGDTEKRLILIK